MDIFRNVFQVFNKNLYLLYRMSNPKFDVKNLKNLEVVLELHQDGSYNASFVARYVHVLAEEEEKKKNKKKKNNKTLDWVYAIVNFWNTN